MSGSRTQPIIAIDGPAGAGKSTVARRLAQSLGYLWIDTGALYRGVALAAQERGISWTDEVALGALVAGLDIQLETTSAGASKLLLDGVDRSTAIRTPEISQGASLVSRCVSVRQPLLELQRRLAARGAAVLEGRDIGTVVFPDAEFKIFLTAPVEVRAQRRFAELQQQGLAVDADQTLQDVHRRDEQDATRAIAPLRPAADAIVFDTAGLSVIEVVAQLVQLVRKQSP